MQIRSIVLVAMAATAMLSLPAVPALAQQGPNENVAHEGRDSAGALPIDGNAATPGPSVAPGAAVDGSLLTTLYRDKATPARESCKNADALGTSRVMNVGGGVAIGLKTYPQTLALKDHEIVLTFDDGPSPATTPAVLNALAAQCVKATFFLIGENAEKNPGLVKREIAEGHSVGHHSWSHPAITLRGLADGAGRQEVERGIEADELAGWGKREGLAGAHFPFFRFPGFADTPDLVKLLIANNFTVFGADVWASDWKTMSPTVQRELLFARLEKVGRGIVLLHDTRQQTADMLPEFLAELKRRKFQIVHIVPVRGPTETVPAGNEWKSETEDIIARVLPRLAHSKPAVPEH
jgi:peptidoglycan/xylan/chitin deacetylase (PgdA/CDA1 family)